jgi:type II secretory pathway component PulK
MIRHATNFSSRHTPLPPLPPGEGCGEGRTEGASDFPSPQPSPGRRGGNAASRPTFHGGCGQVGYRRGSILITAMWVMVILGALVIVFARAMRVELAAAANRASANQADAIELGAEQYVLSQVDNIDGEADYVLSLPGEALTLSDSSAAPTGYFWLMRPAANESTYEFGIIDEASKLNLNYANQAQMIQLPGINTEFADSIIDWIDTDSNVTGGDGAESDYYSSLPEPYQAKNQPMETPGELQLVKGFDPTQMWGIDRNRNGVVEPGEASQGSMSMNSNGVSSNRGIAPFVTVFTAEPTTDMQGNARINVNSLATGVGGRNGVAAGGRSGGGGRTVGRTGGGNSAAANQLLQVLEKGMSASKAQAAVQAAQDRGPFTSIFDFAQKANLTSQDIRPIADSLSFVTGNATSLPGLIDVATAPREVLLTLPGLQPSDVDTLIAERQTTDTSSIAWVSDAMSMANAAKIGPYITNRSFFYSADIVAVSPDGRAFKRVYIVVDARLSPAKIIYRQDKTQFGWPLPEQVRNSLRQGLGPGSSIQGTVASGGGGFGQMGPR